MEFVVIEKETYERLLSEMRQLASRVELLDRKSKDRRLSKWLSGEEVCDFLHASRKTLQIYRKEKLLPYIELKGKCLYKESDIERLLRKNYKRLV